MGIIIAAFIEIIVPIAVAAAGLAQDFVLAHRC